MQILKLRLSQFRNFESQEVSLKSRLNFFLGRNGQGKTNLLEAVFMLSRGESFRPAHSEHFLNNHVDNGARIFAQLESHVGKRVLNVDFSSREEGARRSAYLDKKRTNFSTLSAEIPVVLFSPESLAAIKEGPDQRRELIDSVLMTSSERHSKLLREFARVLRARNTLLKQIAKGDGRKTTRDSLESLTSVFLVLATQVTEARLRMLEALLPLWRESVAQIFRSEDAQNPFPEPVPVNIAYEISGENAFGWSENQIFDAISQRRLQLATRERELGASLVGPHKHDLRFLFDENDSRFYCSQGQQRALILALKIAQITLHQKTHGRYPILLLDDVMSELDSAKRTRLMEFLEGITAQVLITATDLTWSKEFSLERNAVFVVEQGKVSRQDGPSAIRDVDLIVDTPSDAAKPSQQAEV